MDAVEEIKELVYGEEKWGVRCPWQMFVSF